MQRGLVHALLLGLVLASVGVSAAPYTFCGNRPKYSEYIKLSMLSMGATCPHTVRGEGGMLSSSPS